MSLAIWLDACARRLLELDPLMQAYEADQIAIRLWSERESPSTYREMHPVAAAERWHRDFGKQRTRERPAPSVRSHVRRRASAGGRAIPFRTRLPAR